MKKRKKKAKRYPLTVDLILHENLRRFCVTLEKIRDLNELAKLEKRGDPYFALGKKKPRHQ